MAHPTTSRSGACTKRCCSFCAARQLWGLGQRHFYSIRAIIVADPLDDRIAIMRTFASPANAECEVAVRGLQEAAHVTSLRPWLESEFALRLSIR